MDRAEGTAIIAVVAIVAQHKVGVRFKGDRAVEGIRRCMVVGFWYFYAVNVDMALANLHGFAG